VGVLGTPSRDHGEAIEQEEQEGRADGDNGVGEACINWISMEREDKEGPGRRVTIVRLERGFCLGKLEDRL
jgi:hypothetical protein